MESITAPSIGFKASLREKIPPSSAVGVNSGYPPSQVGYILKEPSSGSMLVTETIVVVGQGPLVV